jgi:alkylhydroperoxidase family enzyme
MARVPYLDAEDLPEEHKPLLSRPINLFRALVNSPGAAKAMSGLGGYIRHGSQLDGRVRELAILQVGWLAKSPYEWSHHVKIGKDFGLNDTDIEALKAETAGKTTSLSPLERLALKGAREMAVGGEMTEATFKDLEEHLQHDLLIDLIVTIGFYCAVVRILLSLGIDVEHSYQPYLDAHPLPE